MSMADIKNVLTVAHDLICSVLLFLVVISQVRQHQENRRRLEWIMRRLGGDSEFRRGD